MKLTKQFYVGVVLILFLLGLTIYLEADLAIRLLLGTAIGYILSRGFIGFAGSINRAYRTGSTKLMRYMMLMFFITAVLFSAVTFAFPEYREFLKIYPINLGLVIGAFLFGIGMSFASCCASGVLCDMTGSSSRSGIALFFFMMGAFLGFAPQNTWSIITEGTEVYLPDLVDGKFNGFAFGLIITGILVCIVIFLAYKYEEYAKNKLGQSAYLASEQPVDNESLTMFQRIFEKPFTLPQTAFLMSITVTILLIVSQKSWGVSSAFGYWFGKILMLFGFSAEQLGEFTHKGAEFFEPGILEYGGSVQNIGILLGAFIFIFTASRMQHKFKISGKEVFIYAMGGLLMGIATRFANGCNAGALYMPISALSMSGWVFFIFMAAGGVLGNIVLKKIK